MTTKNQNLIALLTTNLHSEQVPNTYKIIINALTGVVGSSLVAHVKGVNRGEYPPVPTLDERNEADEAARGLDESNAHNEDFGIAFTEMRPYQIAQIADGIRHALYEELPTYGEFAPASALHITPPRDIHAPINFNQPMSLEMYMDFRIKMAGTVNEKLVKLGAVELSEPEDIIRAALQQRADKDRTTLIFLKPSVMVEASSLDDAFDIDAFETLDITVQGRIAEKISEKFSEAYARLLPYAIGNLDRASDLNQIKMQHAVVKTWLLDNDKELRDAKAVQAALRSQKSLASV